MHFPPIPPSQVAIARQVARSCWREAKQNADETKQKIGDRMRINVGAGFLPGAILLAEQMVDGWDARGIKEPGVMGDEPERYFEDDET